MTGPGTYAAPGPPGDRLRGPGWEVSIEPKPSRPAASQTCHRCSRPTTTHTYLSCAQLDEQEQRLDFYAKPWRERLRLRLHRQAPGRTREDA